MRRLATTMLAFVAGVAVGGDFPRWVVIGFPALCVLWLSVYDDLNLKRKLKESVACKTKNLNY